MFVGENVRIYFIPKAPKESLNELKPGDLLISLEWMLKKNVFKRDQMSIGRGVDQPKLLVMWSQKELANWQELKR